MTGLDPHRNPGQFRAPEALGPVDAGLAANIIAASADIALIIDREGVIRDLACSEADISPSAYQSWVGQPWIETVAEDSQAKVNRILEDARDTVMVSWREINQRTTATGQDLPIRFSAVRLAAEGRILAIGRDLRAIATLQQQLVGAQQAMEREYARLRHAETRYRLLFQIASEAVLIVDAATHRIVEANPAAGALMAEPPNRLVGRELSKLFVTDGWPAVQTLLATVRVAGWAEDVRAELLADENEALVSASLFRQDSGSLFLIRMSRAGGGGQDVSESRMLEVVHKLPDAFVVVDENRRILGVNASFLDLTQLATEQQVIREPLDQWVGRPGVDAGLLIQNTKEHGTVRNFSTVIRGQYGTDEDVEVSGVAAAFGDAKCYGFMIRPIASRFPFEAQSNLDLPQSVEQLTGLVGRVPLKDIVRQTTDVIESLCIEAALEVSGDNRASAAQMLGLSRQSLYAKLRRLEIGDQESGGDS